MFSLLKATVFIVCLETIFASRRSDLSENVLKVFRAEKFAKNLHFNSTKQTDNDVISLSHDQLQAAIDKMLKNVDGNTNKEARIEVKQCQCQGIACGCCYRINIPQISMRANVCLNIAVLTQQIGIQVTLTVDGRVIIKETISAKNPPAFCADIPFIHKWASLCLDLSNLNFSAGHFSGCASLQARLLRVVVANINLGCFKIPPSDNTSRELP